MSVEEVSFGDVSVGDVSAGDKSVVNSDFLWLKDNYKIECTISEIIRIRVLPDTAVNYVFKLIQVEKHRTEELNRIFQINTLCCHKLKQILLSFAIRRKDWREFLLMLHVDYQF